MNILYIAYSCSPEKGSEDRIGWKLPLAAAGRNNVLVITKEERRAEIEAYRAAHDLPPVRFYYADIPAAVKAVCRGSAYSLRLNLWHEQALQLAEELCRRERVDVIHQITPVEFRSIGDYGKIPNAKFVCGPVGGGEYIPREFWQYAGRHLPLEAARMAVNQLARWRLRRKGILSRCHALLFANRETERWLAPVLEEDVSFGICPETGIGREEITGRAANGGNCHFLVAGRLIYRKGHALLLDALSGLPEELDWYCTILGSGPELCPLKKRCKKLGLFNRVTFLENIPFSEMERIYEAAHVLVMPSLRETTGSVLLEAMARGLPVIAPDRFGGAAFVDDSTGWLYSGQDTLRAALLHCIQNPEEVRIRGKKAAMSAENHTWEKKAAFYQKIYEQIVTPEG